MALTKSDLVEIENIVDRKLEEKLEEKLSQFRSDLYNKIDPILKEIVDSRDERVIVSHRISEHGDRLEDHEKRIGKLEASV